MEGVHMTIGRSSSIYLGRLLLAVGLAILIILFSWEVFSDELPIIEVRRNIPLADDEPVYKDFYINVGNSTALKKNMVVLVERKMPMRDALGANSFGELMIPVGQLKIIMVRNRIAVAREFKLIPRDDAPMLDQIGIMIGDQLNLEGSFVDNSKPSAKKSE